MATKLTMPQLGEAVHEGVVTRWLKQPGEPVQEFDPLVEINTDKVDTEIPSPSNGVLLQALAQEGETVQVGALLGWIGEPGEQVPGQTAASEAVSVAAQPATQAASAPEAVAAPARDLGFISPVVAKIAGEKGVDLNRVKGTGLGGRITKKDILAYLEAAPAALPAQPAQAPQPSNGDLAHPAAKTSRAPSPTPAAGELLPFTPVRKAIAEHMVHSKRTSPHVTTVMEVDLSRVVQHRQANKENFARNGANLTFTPYFLTAITNALKAYPIVNSSWDEQGIRLHREINLGMATSLGEGGLIVPVIKQADGLSLLGLARAVNDLAARSRAKQLKPDEVKGGTFTLTNHGISGSLFATPIINQPQCGILGVGAIQKRAVVLDDPNSKSFFSGSIAIRPMVYISLTFDHRILDGAIADYFLSKVVESLQSWS